MSKSNDNIEIFISGGGPVGLAAAVELRRRGFTPRIIDPDPIVSPESRALAVNSRTLELLEPSGVTDLLIAAGQKMKKLVIRRNQKIITMIDLTKIPHRFNFLLALPQSKTEEILETKLAEMGIRLERNLSLKNFKSGSSIGLELSDGSTSETDMLIGADGAHSLVRHKLGLGFDGESDQQEFGLCDVYLDDWPFAFDTIVLTILDTHLAPFIPMSEGYGRFISTIGDSPNNLPPDAKVKKIAWETDFKISYRQASSYQKDNIFLAGDAAHIHSPVGGRGMNLGIEDACWLAWLIEQGRAAEYTDLRHPVGKQVLKFTHSFTSFAKNRGLLQDILIGCLAPLVPLLPPVQSRIFRALTALNTPVAPWL